MNNLSFLFATTTFNQESIKLLDGDLTLYKRSRLRQYFIHCHPLKNHPSLGGFFISSVQIPVLST
jgi:hypothetical protein